MCLSLLPLEAQGKKTVQYQFQPLGLAALGLGTACGPSERISVNENKQTREKLKGIIRAVLQEDSHSGAGSIKVVYQSGLLQTTISTQLALRV